MRCAFLICTVIAIFLLSPSFAAPQLAEKAVLKVKQSLEFSIRQCENVKIRVYIPQEDEFQKILSLKASLPFRKLSDEYGNLLLEFSPKSKRGRITITTLLRVSRRRAEITPDEFEKLAGIAKRVYEMLEYSKEFANVTLSPEEILEKKKGTCDEFSTLMIHFLRKNGISACYEVGYAYEAFDFQPHGWVRAKVNGKTLDFDPTWCEFPVDAFHVKFASLPSAFFNETRAQAVCYGDGKISISPQKVEIKVVNASYLPLVQGELTFLERKAKYNFYTLAEIKLFSRECVLTALNLGKCVDETGRAVLEPYAFPECVYFCGLKKVFAIFKAGNASYEAECRISAKPLLGNLSTGKIVLESSRGEKVWLNTTKTVVSECETVPLTSNGHIFTLEDFYAFKKGYLKVCKNTTVYALRDSLTKIEIRVKKSGRERQERKSEAESAEKGLVLSVKRVIEFFRELLSFLI